MTRFRKQYARDIERFRTCHYCGEQNTEQIGLSDDFDHSNLTYVGWCWDCSRGYGYRTRIDTVIDRKGRI